MDFSDIYSGNYTEDDIESIISEIRRNGPVNSEAIEILSHIKNSDPDRFRIFENELVSSMGLFYKNVNPNSLYGIYYESIGELIKEKYGEYFTPVQLSIMKHVNDKNCFSFSAPTSSGKSHTFRYLIRNSNRDVVIILPSRALISEYMQLLNEDNGDMLLMQFIDRINLLKSKKRVYIITPERGGEIFSVLSKEHISLFLFDEAQLADEPSRGIIYDALVRRIFRKFPDSKKIFAHPFITNPEAQFIRNDIPEDGALSKCYTQQTVGRIFVKHEYCNKKHLYSCFSPYNPKMGLFDYPNDIIKESIRNKETILIYASKAQIQNKKTFFEFRDYIFDSRIMVNSDAAYKIIDEIADYIGADVTQNMRHSLLVTLMKRGIVYHHGSMPLKVRALVEKFVRNGHARVCIATSTLLQGINMPFSIVWIRYYRFGKNERGNLSLKNLIGRAGRSSDMKELDIGKVIIESKNLNSFRKMINKDAKISKESKLSSDSSDMPIEEKEFIDSIQNETFDSKYNMPQNQLKRLQNLALQSCIQELLQTIFHKGEIISSDEFFSDDSKRSIIRKNIHKIYEAYLNRELKGGEKAVISEAVSILISRITYRDLKTIVFKRLAHIKNSKNFFTPKANSIPNIQLHRSLPLFKKPSKYEYDELVFDTYDYIDKIIGLSLSSPICAALANYAEKTHDSLASRLINYIKYGTDDGKEIWLIRYGFTLEEFSWLLPCVESVDEQQIIFNDKINDLSSEQRERIRIYE